MAEINEIARVSDWTVQFGFPRSAVSDEFPIFSAQPPRRFPQFVLKDDQFPGTDTESREAGNPA